MVFKHLFLLFLITSSLHSSDMRSPWGKDSTLLEQKGSMTPSLIDVGATTLIRFHQTVLSEADGPRSHFKPSSSAYMLEAIQKHGLFTGFCLGCDRLMRENSAPWIYSSYKTQDGDFLKWDPVPVEGVKDP